MFDNVSRATELANDIREMWGRWQQLETLRDGYRRNFDHRGGMAYQYRMDELQERINECRVQWQAETGKRWRPDYYNLPPTDVLMEMSFAALANDLAYQDAELLQEVVDLWDVWGWLQDYGGYMTRIKRSKDSYGTLIAINTVDPDGGKVEYANLHQAANAIRIVRKYRVKGEGYA